MRERDAAERRAGQCKRLNELQRRIELAADRHRAVPAGREPHVRLEAEQPPLLPERTVGDRKTRREQKQRVQIGAERLVAGERQAAHVGVAGFRLERVRVAAVAADVVDERDPAVDQAGNRDRALRTRDGRNEQRDDAAAHGGPNPGVHTRCRDALDGLPDAASARRNGARCTAEMRERSAWTIHARSATSR